MPSLATVAYPHRSDREPLYRFRHSRLVDAPQLLSVVVLLDDVLDLDAQILNECTGCSLESRILGFLMIMTETGNHKDSLSLSRLAIQKSSQSRGDVTMASGSQ